MTYLRMGRHNGIGYKRLPIRDVLAVETKAAWWFICDDDGKPTADHFRTLAELKRHIDESNQSSHERVSE